MSRWFRLYDEVLDDPKVQRLPPPLFKTWINLLCAASRNDGWIPRLDVLAFMLRRDEGELGAELEALAVSGLLDKPEDTPFEYVPHNWNGRQFKSDVTDPTNNERQRRYRKRHGVTQSVTVETVTPPVTDKRPDTETDTDTEKERGGADAPPKYVFEGQTIRLKPKEFTKWRTAYSAIPDMVAELTKADDYYSVHPPPDGKWFYPVSRWLEKKHEEVLAARKAAMTPTVKVAI